MPKSRKARMSRTEVWLRLHWIWLQSGWQRVCIMWMFCGSMSNDWLRTMPKILQLHPYRWSYLPWMQLCWQCAMSSFGLCMPRRIQTRYCDGWVPCLQMCTRGTQMSRTGLWLGLHWIWLQTGQQRVQNVRMLQEPMPDGSLPAMPKILQLWGDWRTYMPWMWLCWHCAMSCTGLWMSWRIQTRYWEGWVSCLQMCTRGTHMSRTELWLGLFRLWLQTGWQWVCNVWMLQGSLSNDWLQHALCRILQLHKHKWEYMSRMWMCVEYRLPSTSLWVPRRIQTRHWH